jgi:pyridoxamine 5'-phosphate oxidase family protein
MWSRCASTAAGTTSTAAICSGASTRARRAGPTERGSRLSAFTPRELDYLRAERRLGRIATVGKNGVPHVAPVGWRYNTEYDAIEVGGRDLARTKKYRDVEATGRAAIVIDDLASTDPWRPRGVEVRGRAQALDEPTIIRIHPERIVSWGL